MTPRAYISVTLAPDGKTPVRHLVYEGVVVGEMSVIDVVELLAQGVGTFRWEPKVGYTEIAKLS